LQLFSSHFFKTGEDWNMKRLGLIGLLVVCAVSFGRGISLAQEQELEAQTFLAKCKTEAGITNSLAILRTGKKTIMWCALIDREGRLLMIRNTDKGGTPQNPMGSDAWRGSIEIAIAKAYTALGFSSNDQALDSRAIGALARTDMGFPTAPLFGIGNTNPFRPPFGFGLGTDDSVGGFHHGIVTFPGGEPVYTKPGSCGSGSGILIGGFGVSGDGVDQDETVAKNTVTDAGFCLTP
jgi:uncharacterized protein GlcG (DUF336 family)